MSNPTFRWSIGRLATLIEEMQALKFDCIIIIEGNRGTGKSTLAYHICNRVKTHKFAPKKDILYKRREIINAFNDRWFSTFMGDELINVTFNRDFYDTDQKKLIKIMNMNRDHCNLFVACVPQFSTIDNQVKNMCKIRITVIRRGLAIVQTQNRSIYTSDRWDSQINEKIEREWLKNGVSKPRYARLTTFRGILTFGDLTPNQREEYEEIKRTKRNEIKQEQEAEDQGARPADRMYGLLTEGKIGTRQMFDNMCIAMGLKPLNVMQNIRIRMRNEGDSRKFQEFFVDEYKEVGEHGVIPTFK
jgi:uridine kinase